MATLTASLAWAAWMVVAAPAEVSRGPTGVQTTAALTQSVAAGEWSRAHELLRALELELASVAPLRLFDGQVLVAPPAGLGMYEAAPKGAIGGDELFLYAQVQQHMLRPSRGGYELSLASDLVLLGAAGEELARDEDLGRSAFWAKAAHRDTFVVVALRVKGLAAGPYRARWTVRDTLGGKQATIELPFTMGPRTGATP